MQRKDFLKKTTAAITLASFGSLPLTNCQSTTKKITILHTNDVHSHIVPFAPNHKLYANKGGVARRATLINKIRQENPNTLLLDAGDIFQGTPYFNYYGGEIEFKLMSMLKYDAATIGNHDFDNGIEGLYAQLPHAKFDFLCANYNFDNTILNTHTKPYKIFNLEGIKIGVFGLGIELQGLVSKNLYKETKYLDPIETSQDITNTLKNNEHCDIIICLSHLGYKYENFPKKICDINLARATKNIDLIIGGHTHTFLPKPTIETNAEGKKVLINQVGAFGLLLGKIDFYLSTHQQLKVDWANIGI